MSQIQGKAEPHTASFEIFPWNHNLETGIEIIDVQHRQLVHLLNQLATQHVQGARQSEVQRILQELADYAHYHFETEEAIWQQALGEDSWFSQHCKVHHDFFVYIDRLLHDERPFDIILEELFAYLTQWLALHILDSDKRMAKAVRAIEEGLSLAEAEARANEEMSGATRLMIETVLSMYQKLSSQALELMREKQARLKAEQALQRSEARWQFLREKVQGSLWEWSSSQTQEELWACLSDAGYQVFREDATALRQTLEAFLCDPETPGQNFRYRQINAEQNIGWLELRLKALERDAQGRALSIIGARYDQSEAQRQMHLLQQAINSSSISVSLADAQAPDMPLIYVNPAFEKLTGYPAEEVLGKNCRFLHTQYKEQADLNRLRNALRAGEAVSVTLRNHRRDGTPFWNELHLSPLYSSEGELTHFLGIQQDVTVLKDKSAALEYQADCNTLLFEIARTFINLPLSARAKALQESESHYRQILNVAPVGIAVHRADAQLSGLYINPITVQLAGVESPAQLLEQPFQKAIYPDDWPKIETALQQLQSGQNIFPIDCRILRFKDVRKGAANVDPGQLLEVEMIATPMSYQGEAAYLIILVDISERKRHERAIEAQNKALKEISWLQSHQVRAPLARMMGLIQLLESSAASSTPGPLSETELLQAIMMSAYELDGFIHEISDKAYEVYQVEVKRKA